MTDVVTAIVNSIPHTTPSLHTQPSPRGQKRSRSPEHDDEAGLGGGADDGM